MKTRVFSGGREVPLGIPMDQIPAGEVGLFETVRFYGGRVFCEDEHLQRLCASAKTAGFSKPIDLARVRRELRGALKAYGTGEGIARITVIGKNIFVMIGSRTLSDKVYRRGVTLKTSPVRRSLSQASFPEAKTAAFHNGVLASLEPADGVSGAAEEWVFLNQAGYVTEVRTGNLFLVLAGKGKHGPRLGTPPAQGILNGVTRRFVIKCALKLGWQVEEKPVTRHDFYCADEAFLTNTAWEILPVRSLDGREIGSAAGRFFTHQLHQIFKKEILKACRPTKSNGR